MCVEERAHGRLAPGDSKKDAASESVRTAGRGKNGDEVTLAGVLQGKEAEEWREANSGGENVDEGAERKQTNKGRGDEIELLFDGERPGDAEPDPRE